MENELEDFVRKNREDFDSEVPDAELLHKIKRRLKTRSKSRVISLSQWLAAASILVVVGVYVFWSQFGRIETTRVVERTEFDLQKEGVFVSLNNSASASQRLSGALAAARLEKTDKSVVDTLVRVMTTDGNSNVRLASLEALSKFYREKYVREQTLASLPRQDDPVVKSALIAFLSQMNEMSIADELLKIVADKTAEREIKDQAYQGLFKLNKL